MPPKGYTSLSVNVSPKELEAVNELAHDRGFDITSDYVRHLIEEDAKAHGKAVKFAVKRGGYRERKAFTRRTSGAAAQEEADDDALWDESFANSQDFLEEMSKKVRAQHAAGLTEDFDPDTDPSFQ